MNQRRLQGVAGLVGQPGDGELPQLVVDQRKYLCHGRPVAGTGRVE